MKQGMVLLALLGACSQDSPGDHARILAPLGEAWGKDYGLPFAKVTTAAPVEIKADNQAEWKTKLEKSLSVGYMPEAGVFKTIPGEKFSGLAKIQMAGDRTPTQVAQAVLQPGVVVVESTWHFEKGEPVKSLTVFSVADEPLFDSLLSLPVVQVPLFSAGHY